MVEMILNDKEACRICLSTKVKLYHLKAFQLKSSYEQIIGEVLTKDDELLHFFCYQCSAMLQKFNSFRKLCIKSQESQKKIIAHNVNIPLESNLKWEQYYNKIHPLIVNLDDNAKIGYFEYNGNDITSNQSDDPLSPAESSNICKSEFDNEDEHDFDYNNDDNENVLEEPTNQILKNIGKSVSSEDKKVKKHNFNNNDTNENVFEESTKQVLKNTDKSISSVSDKKVKKHDINYNNDVSENVLEKLSNLVSKNIGKPISSVLAEEHKNDPSTEMYKKRRGPRTVDPTKWKIVVLSKEEACELFHARRQEINYKIYKYNCEYCQRSYQLKKWLNKHMSYHTEAYGKYECFLCKRRYPTDKRRTVHEKQHLMKYHCLQCPEVFSDRTQITLHEKYHQGVEYVCPHCDIKFLKKKSYYTHLRTIHRSSHLCQFCGASFLNEVGLRHHKRIAHRSNVADCVASNSAGAATNTYCGKCDIIFETLQAYENHKKNSAMHVDDDMDNFKSGKRKLLKAAAKRVWEVVCHECGKVLRSGAAYLRHRRLAHALEPDRYICEICGASLAPGSVGLHLNTHTHAKKYPCPVCGRDFHAPRDRTRHMLVHTGERPYACGLCPKRYRSRANLTLHVSTYHMKQPRPPRIRDRKNTLPRFANLQIRDK